MDSVIIFGLDAGSLVAIVLAVPFIVYLVVQAVKESK